MGIVPKVFISYAWEDQAHQDRVLAFADRLEELGIEVIFDQYEPKPVMGWPKWMDHAITNSDYVLSICTEKYFLRVKEEQPAGEGLGAQWEGSIIYNVLCSSPEMRNKFAVVQFDAEILQHIPEGLKGNNRFVLSQFDLGEQRFEALYRLLTDQPDVVRPLRGEIVKLKRRERTQVPRSGAGHASTGLQMMAADASQTGPHRKRAASISPPRGRGTALERLARKLSREMLEARANEDHRAVVSLGQKVLKVDGQFVLAHYYVGVRLIALHDYESARSHLAAYLERYPEDDDAFIHLQRARWHLGEFDALDLAQRTYQADRSNNSTAFTYSLLLYDTGDINLAERTLGAYARETGRQDNEGQRASYVWQQGQTAKAVEILEAVPNKDTGDWINLGVGHAEMGRFGLAIEAINQGLAARPKYAFARYALAEIYGLMGDLEACLLKLRQLAEVDSIELERVPTEKAFDSIRETPEFHAFWAEYAAKTSRPVGF